MKRKGGHDRVHQSSIDDVVNIRSKKQRLILERGHACETCLNTSWMNKPIPIQIDHIDGNSDNDTKENLRLLCPNCHALTSTYCARNIGKHIKTRRSILMKNRKSYRYDR